MKREIPTEVIQSQPEQKRQYLGEVKQFQSLLFQNGSKVSTDSTQLTTSAPQSTQSQYQYNNEQVNNQTPEQYTNNDFNHKYLQLFNQFRGEVVRDRMKIIPPYVEQADHNQYMVAASLGCSRFQFNLNKSMNNALSSKKDDINSNMLSNSGEDSSSFLPHEKILNNQLTDTYKEYYLQGCMEYTEENLNLLLRELHAICDVMLSINLNREQCYRAEIQQSDTLKFKSSMSKARREFWVRFSYGPLASTAHAIPRFIATNKIALLRSYTNSIDVSNHR